MYAESATCLFISKSFLLMLGVVGFGILLDALVCWFFQWIVNVCCFAVDMQALTERRLKLEEVRKTNSGFNALGDQE